MTDEKYEKIIAEFNLCGNVTKCEPYGNGHINDTFLVVCENGSGVKQYILQRMNKRVFPKPEQVMLNIESVLKFLEEQKVDKRSMMSLVPTLDGHFYILDDDGEYWRMYDFIENSLCLEKPESNEDFYESAVAFGRFQKQLSRFPAEKLYEVIPNFHNTPIRFDNFINAVNKDALGRAASVKEEIEFVKQRKDFCSVLIDANKNGDLPLRVTHNDTKINNVMLDSENRKALCVIDLDTIMPGFSVTDFGDAIRFGANTAAEDEKDLSKVLLDLDLFDSYASGFIKSCGDAFGEKEIMLMPEGAKMMTLECGMRFLTDYLEGDVYFKTAYPEHNLVRARDQFKLVFEMEKHWDEMKNIVKKYI